MMNGRRKSDSCVVPTKSANKLMPSVSAEQMEGRRLVKGNADACSTSRTLRRPRHASGTNPQTIGDVYANRHNLRQEPDALEALVRICGGGAQQCASLLRLKTITQSPDPEDNTFEGAKRLQGVFQQRASVRDFCNQPIRENRRFIPRPCDRRFC
jgi:hypothetical protein